MNARSYSSLFAWFCATTALAVGSTAFCDEPAEQVKPVKITLHPQAAPVPSLKYRLLPDRLSQQRGNAAVQYGKVTADDWYLFANAKLAILDWHEKPLEELRGGKVKLPTDAGIEASLRRGALCTDCDWQLPIGEVPFYGMQLPDAQQTVVFAKLLAARARIQMADHQYEDVITTLQTGYALARNVATGETIVNGIVGVHICDLMNQEAIDFVQQPQAPNLYWAVTDLPTPMIEIHRALEVERMGIELSYPVTAQARTAKKEPGEWEVEFDRIFGKELPRDVSDGQTFTTLSLGEIGQRCDERLPAAKKYLIAGGIPEEEVDRMPKFQIAMLYSLALFHENIDDAARYCRLPYPEAIAAIREVEKRVKHDDKEIVPISHYVVSAIAVSREAPMRVDRIISVLRIFEALRLYAASHDGKLPDSLSSITEVPIPNDPATGKPFEYELSGNKAKLWFVRGPMFADQALEYEITMANEK